MALIYDMAQQLKTEMLARNNAALKDITTAYQSAWKRLNVQLQDITAQIRDAQAQGKSVSFAWLGRQERYQTLITQIEGELRNFGQTVVPVIKTQQQLALDFGENHSSILLKLSMGDTPPEVLKLGLNIQWNSVPAEAVQNIVGYLSDGSPLEYKFIGMSARVVEGVKSAFSSGLIMGKNPRDIARDVKKVSDGEFLNSVVTARTETLRAYRQASQETYKANSDVVEGWIWSCAHSGRTCAACWGMDGTFHALSEELNDHVCGRCCSIPKTKSWQELYPQANLSDVPDTSAQPWNSEEYFKKLSEDEQLRVLGAKRHDLWKNGDITLRDIPRVQQSKTWGDSIRIGNINETKEKSGVDKAA